jgi:hypothetical protein
MHKGGWAGMKFTFRASAVRAWPVRPGRKRLGEVSERRAVSSEHAAGDALSQAGMLRPPMDVD